MGPRDSLLRLDAAALLRRLYDAQALREFNPGYWNEDNAKQAVHLIKVHQALLDAMPAQLMPSYDAVWGVVWSKLLAMTELSSSQEIDDAFNSIVTLVEGSNFFTAIIAYYKSLTKISYLLHRLATLGTRYEQLERENVSLSIQAQVKQSAVNSVINEFQYKLQSGIGNLNAAFNGWQRDCQRFQGELEKENDITSVWQGLERRLQMMMKRQSDQQDEAITQLENDFSAWQEQVKTKIADLETQAAHLQTREDLPAAFNQYKKITGQIQVTESWCAKLQTGLPAINVAISLYTNIQKNIQTFRETLLTTQLNQFIVWLLDVLEQQVFVLTIQEYKKACADIRVKLNDKNSLDLWIFNRKVSTKWDEATRIIEGFSTSFLPAFLTLQQTLQIGSPLAVNAMNQFDVFLEDEWLRRGSEVTACNRQRTSLLQTVEAYQQTKAQISHAIPADLAGVYLEVARKLQQQQTQMNSYFRKRIAFLRKPERGFFARNWSTITAATMGGMALGAGCGLGLGLLTALPALGLSIPVLSVLGAIVGGLTGFTTGCVGVLLLGHHENQPDIEENRLHESTTRCFKKLNITSPHAQLQPAPRDSPAVLHSTPVAMRQQPVSNPEPARRQFRGYNS